jgi:ABC-2 type transport system ATP-binding protein
MRGIGRMTPLIETQDLSKHFRTLTAVEGVSLRVAPGEVLALLGPNGAGKTTTIRMLAAILRPTRGWVRIDGFDTMADPLPVRRRVGMLTEHHGLYTRMRAPEYLGYFGEIYRLPAAQVQRRAEELLERFGLSGDREARLGQYSKGMRQKLALARALIHDPTVLLLDEPTSAMDPESAQLVRLSIAGLRSSQRAIVICTHNLPEAESLADRIAIIRKGRIVAQGTPGELKRSLLGDPIMELRILGALDGAVRLLPEGATVTDRGSDWVRFRVQDPQAVNPRVIQSMTSQGVQVLTLSEVPRSLEEVYLSVMREAPLD